jgi:hypothetical protein
MAVKMNEDDYYSNSFYSKVAGVSLKELNQLEYEFIKYIRYNFWVTKEFYDKYAGYLKHYNVKK